MNTAMYFDDHPEMLAVLKQLVDSGPNLDGQPGSPVTNDDSLFNSIEEHHILEFPSNSRFLTGEFNHIDRCATRLVARTVTILPAES